MIAAYLTSALAVLTLWSGEKAREYVDGNTCFACGTGSGICLRVPCCSHIHTCYREYKEIKHKHKSHKQPKRVSI